MTIVWNDFAEMRSSLYRSGNGKEEMKALPDIPAKAQLKATFEALDDFWEANRATLLTQMRAAYGQSIPAALAKKICIVWLQYKMRKGG